MTYHEAADYLGIQPTTLANLVASGRIHRTTVPGTRRVSFDRGELDRYVASKYVNDRKFIRGSGLTHAVQVLFSESELAEVLAAIPDGYSRSAWIAEQAVNAARLTSRK